MDDRNYKNILQKTSKIILNQSMEGQRQWNSSFEMIGSVCVCGVYVCVILCVSFHGSVGNYGNHCRVQ